MISTRDINDKGKKIKHFFVDKTDKAISTRNIVPIGRIEKEIKKPVDKKINKE